MFRRFGSAEIISAHLGSGDKLQKNAHRAIFQYTPREGYLYFRSRAISSRCNDNFDMFPAEEIKKSYLTFIGKPVFVNHSNDDHRRARGMIIDAALHEDTNPDGSPDTWVEVLHELDAKTYPKLAKAILAGHIDRTSMGTDVQISKCSICHNEATSPLEYCQHIPGSKGKKISVLDPRTGARETKLCFEICSGLAFFENSVLVEQPADPTAFFLGPVEAGTGLEAFTSAAQQIKTATKANPNPDPMFYWRQTSFAKTASVKPKQNIYSTEYSNWLVKQAIQSNDESLEASVNPHSMPTFAEYMSREAGKAKKPISEMTPEEYEAHRAKTAADKAEGEEWNTKNPIHPKHIVAHWNQATDDEKSNGENWYADAHHLAKHVAGDTGTDTHTMAGLLSNYSPQTHWATNIMNAARVARTKEPIGGKGSGVMATANQKKAAGRMLNGEHYDQVLAGPKTRAFAHLIEHGGNKDDNDPRVVVDRHALSVAAGSRASDNAYMYSRLGTKGRYQEATDAYHHAAKQISKQEGRTIHPHQVQAATWLVRQRLNESDDRRLSQTASSSSATRARGAIDEWNKYAGEHHPNAIGKEPGTGYSRREMPEDVAHSQDMQKEQGHAPKMGRLNPFLAYGEIKAPQDVDTLRVETCPICGGTDFDGKQCVVCGYTSAESLFGDPDTSKARNMDQFRETVDPQTGLPAGDPEFEEEQSLEGDDGTDQPLLGCENCGTEFDPKTPETVGEDPVPGEETEQVDEATGQPAEGDVCPVCEGGIVGPVDPSNPSEPPVDEDEDGIPDKDEEDPDEDDDDEAEEDEEEESEDDEDKNSFTKDKRK